MDLILCKTQEGGAYYSRPESFTSLNVKSMCYTCLDCVLHALPKREIIVKIIGKVFGFVFGLIGYILLGVLAVFAFGMAMVFLPIIVICGLGGILALVSRA